MQMCQEYEYPHFHTYFVNMDISLIIALNYLLENVYVYSLDISGEKRV